MMTTTILSDSVAIIEVQTLTTKLAPQMEVEFAKCECCGLTEECTQAYIEAVRERYQGKWICGLCAEAVKDEIVRSERLISADEAFNRHVSFCGKFRSSGPPDVDPTIHLIAAMRQLLRRSLDSPKSMRSTPCSPRRAIKHEALIRSESCIPNLSLIDSSTYDSATEEFTSE